ncbi:uncharacterized protein LOC119614648 [Lucilia sericata]|uniref:uncharacterized protein LOC119614648 n=1 Tax=Lucilia sericata TaxID=13632 RepID=UPI0018A84EF4|nr:uncharacterized protein LOC119614648 [Lucilia sericata]
MKLLYTALIWGLIQLCANKTCAAPNSTNQQPTTAQEQLLLFYENELELLAKESCEKAKYLSEKLLQDPKIQQAKTPLIREFKKNITEFLYNYDFYQRHQLHNDLLTKFIKTTIHYHLQDHSPNKDSQYILQLLKQLQYDELCDEYELKFQKLIKQKFLPKFEKLQKQLFSSKSKQSVELLNWYNDLKHYTVIISPKQQLLQYIREQLQDINIYYSNTAYNISKALLKDPLFIQLSPAVRQQFAKDINDFMENYESNQDVEKLYDLMEFFQNNISQKYFYNTEMSLRDRQLLEQIFNNQELNTFQYNYQLKFNKFLELGLYAKFQEFKVSLNPEELLREKPLFQWFEHLLNLSSYAERVKEFANLNEWI